MIRLVILFSGAILASALVSAPAPEARAPVAPPTAIPLPFDEAAPVPAVISEGPPRAATSNPPRLPAEWFALVNAGSVRGANGTQTVGSAELKAKLDASESGNGEDPGDQPGEEAPGDPRDGDADEDIDDPGDAREEEEEEEEDDPGDAPREEVVQVIDGVTRVTVGGPPSMMPDDGWTEEGKREAELRIGAEGAALRAADAAAGRGAPGQGAPAGQGAGGGFQPVFQIGAPNAEVNAKIQAEKQRLEGEIQTLVSKVKELGAAETPEAAKARNGLAKALDEYRQTLIAELVAGIAGLTPEQRQQFLRDKLAEIQGRIAGIRRTAFEHLVQRLQEASSATEREQIKGQIESSLRMLRIAEELVREALTRGAVGQPTTTRRGLGGRHADPTIARMQDLINAITASYIEQPNTFTDVPAGANPFGYGARDAHRDADQFLKQLERDLNFDEFIHLADNGTILDPATGKPIPGGSDLRTRIAMNAKLELVEALQRAGVQPSLLRTLFGWSDSRLTLAQQLQSDVARNDLYQALILLDPSTGNAPMAGVFTAMAHVVANDVQQMLDWRSKLITDGRGEWTPAFAEELIAEQKAPISLAILMRSGQLDAIDESLRLLQQESAAVVAAFNAAASTPDPKNLTVQHHRLLSQGGWIGTRADGSEFYQLPDRIDTTARLRSGVDIPGASVLDAISGASMIKLVLLVAAPQLAGAKVAALLEGLEVGVGTIALINLMTQTIVNVGMDAAFQQLEVGTVAWDRLVLESLVLGTFLHATGKVAGDLAGVLADPRFWARSSRLATYLKNPEQRKLAEQAIAQALGLSSETAIQTLWQARVQGTGVSYEEFLANAFNGIIARGSPFVGAGIRQALGNRIARYRAGESVLPEWLRRAAEKDPALKAELDANAQRQAELTRQFEEAAARLLKVVGEEATTKDLTDPAVVKKVTDALESGTLLWKDVKTIFSETMPWALEPFMTAVNARRLRLFEGIIATAQNRARLQLLGEYLQARKKIESAFPEGHPERAGALAAADATFQRELDLINAPVKAPGSQNLTSDIDRSIAHPYVRNELKKLTDLVFLRAGGRAATSAQGYDVNEYINVLLVIERMLAGKLNLSGLQVPGTKLTHGDAVEANSMAHAMLHMTPAERARYRENMLSRPGVDRAKVEAQLDYAASSLFASDQTLRAEIKRLGGNPDAPDPDLVTRARDNLYGQRTVELREMEARLEQMDKNSAEYKNLAAEIQRKWNVALRDGIEAYSDFTGLDIIVNRGQLQKRSMRDMIDDPNFTAASIGATPEMLNGALHNQVAMIVEHMHGYFEGHESAQAAAAAISKYAERGVLILKLQGADVSITGPQRAGQESFRELNDIAKTLVEVRGDPDALKAALEAFGGGSADQGLLKLAGLLEQHLPGMKGMLTTFQHGAAGGAQGQAQGAGGESPLSRILGQLALNRELDAQRQQDLLEVGWGGVVQRLDREIADLQAEKQALLAQIQREAELAKLYKPQDWVKAAKLEDQLKAIEIQISNLPLGQTPVGAGGFVEKQMANTSVRNDLERQKESVEAQLNQLRLPGAPKLGVVERPRPVRVGRAQRNEAQQAQPQRTATASGPRTPEQIRRDQRLEQIDIRIRAAEGEREAAARHAQNEMNGLTGPFLSQPDTWQPFLPSGFQFTGADAPNFWVVPEGPAPGTETPAAGEAVDGGEGVRGGRPGAPGAFRLVNPVLDPAALGGPSGRGGGSSPVEIVILSTGGSTGEVMEALMANHGTDGVEIDGAGVALEPVTNVDAPTRVRIEELKKAALSGKAVPPPTPGARGAGPAPVLWPTSKAKVVRIALDAYCLQLLRDVPTAGMVFRIADPKAQQAHAPMRAILEASRRLYEAGQLHPDSDPEEYFHSMRQWAIWTEEQGFDRAGFERAFTEHVRKNFTAAGETWTKEAEEAVRQLVPNRWTDVTRILQEAGIRRANAA